MIALDAETFRAVIAQARLAPSVHNVQPTRWRLNGAMIELLGDPARAIPVADPAGRDWRLSHGAAFEGLAIALARRGLGVEALLAAAGEADGAGLALIARCGLAPLTSAPPDEPVEARSSWRGGFAPREAGDAAGLDALTQSRPDAILIRAPAEIDHAAALADAASLHFLRDAGHRAELLRWMRLSSVHPDFGRDGLNAPGMAMGRLEAFGAGLALGPLFTMLDRLSLAAPLVSERGKTRGAAALCLFHRPLGEDAFETGRAFYRLWLAIERAGFKAVPMSVLADWPVSREALARRHGLPEGRAIASVFRLGRPDRAPSAGRARLPLDELIL